MLSPDFRRCAFSSLDLAPSFDVGVADPGRLGDAFGAGVIEGLGCILGVFGRLLGFGLSGMPSSSSKSASDCGPFAACFGACVAVSSSPMPSNWARSSSSVGLSFFDIAGGS